MKKFIFRLDKVLEYKNSIESKKKAVLGRHVSEYNRVQQKINEAHKTKDKIINNIKKKFSDIIYLNLARQSLAGIEQRFINGKKELLKIQKKIDQARIEFIKARREKQVFEKLKEKKLEQWKKEKKKEMNKQIEESAINLWKAGKLREYEWT